MDLRTQIRPQFRRFSLNFSEETVASVDYRYKILQIAAPKELPFPATLESCKFCREEKRGGYDSNFKIVR